MKMKSKHVRSASITTPIKYARLGIPSLDELLNGGVPLGSFVLLDLPSHSRIFTKAFLGEGSANQDHLFVYSQTPNSVEIGNIKRIGNLSARGALPIRYETFTNTSTVAQPYTIETGSSNSSYKDLKHFELDCGVQDFYHKLWKRMKNDFKEAGVGVSRIVVKDLLGIGWPKQSLSEVFEFLKAIRTLLRSQNAVCVVLVEYRRLEESLKGMMLETSDVVIVGEGERIVIEKCPRGVNLGENCFEVFEMNGAPVLEVAD